MNKTTLLLILLFIIPLVMLPSLTVNAKTRTIVVPDDYQTIQAAVGNSTEGDIIFVRNGTYEGEIDKTLVIDRSISLIGESPETTLNLYPKTTTWSILTAGFSSSEDALQINAKEVIIANLTIKYKGNIVVSNDKVQFLNTKLYTRSTDTGLIINGSECNLIQNSLNGRLNIYKASNNISQNKIYSVKVESGNNNLIEYNDLTYLSLIGSDNIVVSKNNIGTDLISPVVYILNSSYSVLVGNNVTSNLWNTNLGISGKSYNNTIYGNNFLSPAYTTLNSSDYFYNNKEFVIVDSASLSNYWEKGGKGNFWQNYHGSDANWDGIGDIPYTIDAINEDPYPLIKPTYEEAEIGSSQIFGIIIFLTIIIFAVTILLLRRNRKTANYKQ